MKVIRWSFPHLYHGELYIVAEMFTIFTSI